MSPSCPENARQLSNIDVRQIPNQLIQSTVQKMDALRDNTAGDHGYKIDVVVEDDGTESTIDTFQQQSSSGPAPPQQQQQQQQQLLRQKRQVALLPSDPPGCDPNAIDDYRTINGVNNNQQSPSNGMRQQPFKRILGNMPRYKDGISGIKDVMPQICPAMDWFKSSPNCYDITRPLPSVKTVSDTVFFNPLSIFGPHETTASHMVMGWGQFLVHETTKIPANPMLNPMTGQAGSCISQNNFGQRFCVTNMQDARCASICPNNNCMKLASSQTDCIAVVRAATVSNGIGTNLQFNELTAYIDGSAIYGSSSDELSMLRLPSPNDHLLQLTPSGLLPSVAQCPMRVNDCKSTGLDPNKCACSGDDRVNEQPLLAPFHTIFARLHNILATQLWAQNGCPTNPTRNDCWNQPKCFMEARKIVGAVEQIITYNEWLPRVIGPNFTQVFRLNDAPAATNGYEMGYQNAIDATLSIEFSGAAMRWGHSTVRLWWACDPRCSFDPTNPTGLALPGIIETPQDGINQFILAAEQFRTKPYYDVPDQFKRLLEGLMREHCQQSDEMIDESLRSMLFGPPEFDDLGAINTQRGRDMGIPTITELAVWARQHLNDLSPGLGTSFYPSQRLAFDQGQNPQNLFLIQPSDLPMTPTASQKMQSVYPSPMGYDCYPGGLSEQRVPGGLVGPTFATVLAQTFSDLKFGDRFWYANAAIDPSGKPSTACNAKRQAFTRCQLAQIRKVTLSKLLCFTRSVAATTNDPFSAATADTNPGFLCSPSSQLANSFVDIAQYWSLNSLCTGQSLTCAC